jgi:hypothetical protein
LAKTWHYSSLFSEEPSFCLYLLKVKEAAYNFINPQRLFFSSLFSLSQTIPLLAKIQTGATVPFKTRYIVVWHEAFILLFFSVR